MNEKVYLYCDTEFNGFGGELLSMALVEPINRHTFYEEREFKGIYDPWVKENVVPKFFSDKLSDNDFRKYLWHFLKKVSNDYNKKIVVVADWPEDLGHFAMQTCMIGGQRCPVKFDLKLIKSPHEQITDPHCALADAWDLANWAHPNKDKWDV